MNYLRAAFVALVLVAVALSGCVGDAEANAAPATDSVEDTASPASSEKASDPDDQDPNAGRGDGQEPVPVNETPPVENETSTGNQTPEAPLPPGPKPVWGDPETAPIYPGVAISSPNQCTANFLFTSPDYHHIYIGTAAHCSAPPGDPCDPANAEPLAPGSEVKFMTGEQSYVDWWVGGENVSFLETKGTLAYSSYHTQRQAITTDPDGCLRVNDFALIEIPLEAQGLVTPYFRTGDLATGITPPSEIGFGDQVMSYGHSQLWMGQEELYPRYGVVNGAPSPEDDNWAMVVTHVPIAVFGDSGSALISMGGGAIGVLQTGGGTTYNNHVAGIDGVPMVGGNGYVTLHRALEYMAEHTDLRVQLAEP